MQNPSEHPLGDLCGGFGAQRALAADQFEEETVLRCLHKLGVPKAKWQLLSDHQAATGERRLTLDRFCYEFAGFPMYLAARRIRDVASQCSVSRLFMDFGNRIVTKRYREVLDAVGAEQGRPVGMIFNWPNLHGGLLLHNGRIEIDQPGSRMLWVHEGAILTLEPFLGWLGRVNWRPE